MNKRIALKHAAALVVFVALAGCSRIPEGSGSGGSGAGGSETLVTVNNKPVTAGQFKRDIALLPSYARTEFAGADGGKRFLDEIVGRELLYQSALEKGLDRDSEYLGALESFKKAQLASMFIEREIKNAMPVTEADVKKYYDENKAGFVVPPKIHAAHILVKSEQEAKQVSAMLKSGAPFEKLAAEKSIDDSSKGQGGDLGTFPRGSLVPAFEEAAFALAAGSVSAPVKTEFGWHVIKVVEKMPEEHVPVEKVSDYIKTRLEEERRRQGYDDLVKRLKQAAKISNVNDALLKSITEGARPTKPGSDGHP